MLTLTDYLVLFVLVFSLSNGWRRGFFRSLLGPFSLLVCSVVAFFYFQRTHNLFVTLLLCVLGPLFVNILLALSLGLWPKTTSKEIPSSSRLLGALFNLAWNTGIVVLFLAWLLLIPGDVLGLNKIQEDIGRSRSFALFNQFFPQHIPSVHHFQNTWRAIHDPAQRKEIESSLEYKALAEDPKIQAVLADEALLQQIRKGDMGKVINNPKIQAIFQDEKLLKKFFAFQGSLLHKNLPRNVNH